jgi:hypothetical protein
MERLRRDSLKLNLSLRLIWEVGALMGALTDQGKADMRASVARKLLLKLAGIVVLAAAVFAGLFANYVGYFASVEAKEKELGPYLLVYREVSGPYLSAGRVVGDLAKSLHSLGIDDFRGVGIFSENPSQDPQKVLNAKVGVLLSYSDQKRALGVLSRYQTENFPKVKGVAADFPAGSALSMRIGGKRVYPVLEEVLKQREESPRYYLEVYDFSKTTTYFLPFNEIES